MKAVYLLLCIALARDSAGHIFRRQQHRQMDQMMVQPLESIDQYQQQIYPETEQYPVPRQYSKAQQYLQQQKQDAQMYPHQKKDSQKDFQQKQDSQMYYQQKQDSHEMYNQQKQDSQIYNQQKLYKQEKEQQREFKLVRELYPQQLSDDYVQQQQIQKQLQQYQTNKQDSNQQGSDSTESNSGETVVRVNKYLNPVYADADQKTHLNIVKSKKPAYGDATTWKGIQIAIEPKTPIDKKEIEKIFTEAYKTINHFSQENQQIFHQALETVMQTDNENSHLNATQLLHKYQYEVEEHTVKTDDGYYLTLFRIPSKEQTTVQKPVVFLMHGLLGSADDWLLMGPGKSLAFLLADAGYEVWLGNARGSRYCRHHVSKHPAQVDFWQYSNDEIALLDLPAMIDYVLKTSNQQKMYYVGYSQGTTAFFALTSTHPEYNDKIIMMYALSPMAYMSSVRSPMLRMIAPTSQFSELVQRQLGQGQFTPSKELVRTMGGAMCENEIGCPNVCSNINFVMSGFNPENWDIEQIPVVLNHLPAGASTRQIKQYAQGVASHDFTKYDFGAVMNEKVYGTRQPPKYDMQKVQTPVVLYYSEADWLAHPTDVQRLAQELPQVTESYKVPVENFSSLDFQFSKNVPEVVYKRLIESIQHQQNEQNYVY